MKKHFKLLTIAFLGTLAFTACEKDEEAKPEPTIEYGEIVSYDAKTLRGRDNPSDDIGQSFFSCQDGSVIPVNTATANQAKVDFVYYFGQGSGNEHTLAAPADSVFMNPDATNPFEQIKAWTTHNATKFKKVSGFSLADFNASENDSLILTYAKDLSNTKITNLTNATFFAFETAGGKMGICYVQSVNGIDAASRSILIRVKLQK